MRPYHALLLSIYEKVAAVIHSSLVEDDPPGYTHVVVGHGDHLPYDSFPREGVDDHHFVSPLKGVIRTLKENPPFLHYDRNIWPKNASGAYHDDVSMIYASYLSSVKVIPITQSLKATPIAT